MCRDVFSSFYKAGVINFECLKKTKQLRLCPSKELPSLLRREIFSSVSVVLCCYMCILSSLDLCHCPRLYGGLLNRVFFLGGLEYQGSTFFFFFLAYEKIKSERGLMSWLAAFHELIECNRKCCGLAEHHVASYVRVQCGSRPSPLRFDLHCRNKKHQKHDIYLLL